MVGWRRDDSKVRLVSPILLYHYGAKAHRIVPTSFPIFCAYANCSLLSLVLRLILKNTSSPVEETTYNFKRKVERNRAPVSKMSLKPLSRALLRAFRVFKQPPRDCNRPIAAQRKVRKYLDIDRCVCVLSLRLNRELVLLGRRVFEFVCHDFGRLRCDSYGSSDLW